MLPSKTQLATIVAIAFLALAIGAKADDQPDCTVAHSGKFYDLRPLIRDDNE